MSETGKRTTSRREFLKSTGRVATASALASAAIPGVYAAEDNTIRVALVGCGGRGTGAAANVLDSSPEHVRRLHLALQEWDASLESLPGASETPAPLRSAPPAAEPGATGDPNGDPAP